ncbi:hypothetical protein CEUSTIGMA_g6566.t1 [Chlamydomonas eustigma]|uniref:Cation-transporting ATPase n=1 Tax=Chlamydomonas eustigma TaxID=1157962 RepID=A0A250X7U6_9CHLO|nr:hypothetical protein CEUSTIGMA_g6566.t1 [Chlamydomonas eustigma]|eukprot:GAX79126.1 hypothetical protein CEUSTIGMA_g6566.t1 [Chlamydomonas eustigma]
MKEMAIEVEKPKSLKKGQLAVNSKELESVTIVKYRDILLRHDIWPFLVLYFASISTIAYFGGRFQWFEFTIACYALGVCALLHILAFLFTHWNIYFKLFVSTSTVINLEEGDAFFVQPTKYVGAPELVSLERRTLREGLQENTEVGFEFRKQRYVFNTQMQHVEKLRYPVRETFESYAKMTGHGTEQKALAAHDKYGLNKFEVPVPPFAELLKEHLMAPFFVFQVFCVFLWMLDDYWYYSLFTLFMLVSFECTIVNQRLRSLKELRSMQTPKQDVQVYRSGKWQQIPGEGLLVGDLISIGRPTLGANGEEKVVPADCLLLAGTCIVEEAVLTGESTPQWKVSIADLDPRTQLNMKQDKNHILFSGTRILQHTGANNAAKIRTPDGGCLAVTVRTGFETSQGQLMRTILFSSDRVTANSLEAGVFILFLMCFAIAAAYYVLKNGLQDPSRDRFKLVLNCIMIITSVIPPELPMELSMAVNASLISLIKKRIFCTEPFRIPYAGKVEVCCFDKTGTLTSDHLLLEEVVGPGKGDMSDLIMATCQSLVQLEGGDMVGDPLEKASLEATGWSYSNDTATSTDKSRTANIIHRHHFNSNVKRMSAVVHVKVASNGSKAASSSYVAVMKGAPEVVKQLLSDVPPNYDSLYKSYAAQGARVIALASRKLPEAETDPSASLKSMLREDLESEMTWEGFAVFQCPLKDDSEPALKELVDSSHQLMMITGDAPLTACFAASKQGNHLIMITWDAPPTACFAASKVHIVTREVLVLSHKEEETGHAHGLGKAGPRVHTDSEYQWISPDEGTVLPFVRSQLDILRIASHYDLALSGEALSYLESLGLATGVIPLCQVFARVSPEQKELVLVTLKAAGRVTMMCGDGTNDVGGLKAAHVGVALLCATEAQEKIIKQKKAEKEARDAAKASKDAAKASTAQGTKVGGVMLPPLPDAPGNSTSQSVAGNGDIPIPEAPGPLSAAIAGKATEPAKMGKGTLMLEQAKASGKTITPAMEKWAKWMDDMEAEAMAAEGMPMLKPGDASMASPFTAKASGVMPCTDIIKQGRCTLVTTVQMFKILGLLCLSTAYALSVMYLEGVKLSDTQATLNGILSAGMFFCISMAKPLQKLSPTRPHSSIFNPYFFLSLLGQFAVQLSLLMYMYNLALKEMPAEDRLPSEGEFKPNLVNSVCYLVELGVQLTTFGVNYVGHPFNSSIRENRGMYFCLLYGSIFLTLITFDVIPGLSYTFGLVPIPNHIRAQLVGLSLGAFSFNFFLEHTMRNMFPASKPPIKGYMIYSKQLKSVKSKSE